MYGSCLCACHSYLFQIWSRCNMNDTQFWCLGTGEQMLYGWCDWSMPHS